MHVVDGPWLVTESADRDHVECTIGLPVAATMECHPVRSAGSDGDRGDTAETREGRVGSEAVDVLPRGDQELSAMSGANPKSGDEGWGSCGDEFLELCIEGRDLIIECVNTFGEAA